jgi:hypothetical protein
MGTNLMLAAATSRDSRADASWVLGRGEVGPLGFCGVGLSEQLRQNFGDNLAGEAELILQPTALLRLRIAAIRQLLPVVIHLLLRRALDLERDGLVELENRAAVERGEWLSVQLKRPPSIPTRLALRGFPVRPRDSGRSRRFSSF